MSHLFKIKKWNAPGIVLAVMIVYIVWQAAHLAIGLLRPSSRSDHNDCYVSVQGNILHPGEYRVSAGITQFEILKVAGIRQTSDISGFDLAKQVSGDQQLEVGTMPNPVSMKKRGGNVRLEFVMGQINVVAADGKSRIVSEGMEIISGDRILTEEKSQAEFSFNSFSRLDVDEYSECIFDKINADENNKKTVSLFHKSGACWYKIVYADKTEVFKTITPFAAVTVAGTGADFMIVVKQDEIDIHDIDGLLLVERIGGAEAINMISGQSALIFRDNRPFQVTPLTAEINPADRFSILTKAKTDFVARRMPLNFLLCAVPGVYYFISVQFENGKMHVVHIPGSTSIEEFVQGCSTLDQAFLYGGAVFVETLIEQIMNVRIPKYAVFAKSDVLRAAGIFGGIAVDVDEKAAAALKLTRGVHKLSNAQITEFLRPGISSREDFEKRQIRVLKAVFETIRSRNIVLTALLVEQLLANIETNFIPNEIMEQYGKFTEVKNWSFLEHELPIKKVVQNGKSRDDPNLQECKTLLQN